MSMRPGVLTAANPVWISASEIPKVRQQAIVANAFSKLCRPEIGLLKVCEAPPGVVAVNVSPLLSLLMTEPVMSADALLVLNVI